MKKLAAILLVISSFLVAHGVNSAGANDTFDWPTVGVAGNYVCVNSEPWALPAPRYMELNHWCDAVRTVGLPVGLNYALAEAFKIATCDAFSKGVTGSTLIEEVRFAAANQGATAGQEYAAGYLMVTASLVFCFEYYHHWSY